MFIGLVGIVGSCSRTTTKLSGKTVDEFAGQYWQDVTNLVNTGDYCHERVWPLRFRVLKVNYNKLRDTLLKPAPAGVRTVNHDTVVLPVILPSGLVENYKITQIQVMPPDLADKYPDIKTYSGNGVESPTDNIRLDISPKGVTVMILSTRGTMMIDPMCGKDSLHVISYFKKDLPPDAKPEFEK